MAPISILACRATQIVLIMHAAGSFSGRRSECIPRPFSVNVKSTSFRGLIAPFDTQFQVDGAGVFVDE